MVDVLHSDEDASVNFIARTEDGGAFEARYVRRVPEYAITYLSSHTGCDKACRFCHLTAMRQTMMTPASIDDYVAQADHVMKHYATQPEATRMNFNFMARGEPLSNPTLLMRYGELYARLYQTAFRAGIIEASFNISTIMPHETADICLDDVFAFGQANIYYSLYSLNPLFRKRWLPKTIDPMLALRKLADWQQDRGQLVALHWAFIEGENDDEQTIADIISAVRSVGLTAKFNLVRYNPYSERQGREPSEVVLNRNFDMLAEALGHRDSRIVPRVGADVHASCGCFAATL